MKTSSKWIRRVVLLSATGALTAGMIAAASSAADAHSTAGRSQARTVLSKKGPGGYPLPKGIYAPFTDCPLLNPLMQESTPGNATGCVVGDAVTGRIKIGNITTRIKATARVKFPVAVQFGIWDPVNATTTNPATSQFTGGILPPPQGLSAQLVSSKQLVRGGLLKALGCPSSNATVEQLCAEAQKAGGKDLKVYASAQSAGPITGFSITSWFQPVEFHLINPLLGNSCFIGSADNPVVLNPTLSVGKAGLVQEIDPHPHFHPATGVLELPGATAADTTFTAPGVTGCGPGGTANIAVDMAIDTSVGLPTASGADSITLRGNFYLGVCFFRHNMAKILLSAFRASARTNGKAVRIAMTPATLRRFGIRLRHLKLITKTAR